MDWTEQVSIILEGLIFVMLSQAKPFFRKLLTEIVREELSPIADRVKACEKAIASKHTDGVALKVAGGAP